jgi:hypothetical protein
MKHLWRVALLTVGLGFSAIILSFVPRHAVVAAPPSPSVPVNVTNTPLPVNANQAGAWTVGVTNFPASTPVTFTNTSSTPLFVDTDRAARESVTANIAASPNVTGTFSLLPTPATTATNIVIDSLSFECNVNTGSYLVQVFVEYYAPGTGQGAMPTVGLKFYPAMTKIGSTGTGLDVYQWSGPALLYANPQSPITLSVSTSDTSATETCFSSLNGHLVSP